MKTLLPALRCLLIGALAPVCVLSHEEANEAKIFAYEHNLRDLENGLRVLVVNTGFPKVVSLNIPVQVGSRHEVEPGLTGFAHFFEHMMFRGTDNVSAEEFQEFYKEIGASINAATDDDVTNYYAVLPSNEHLEEALMIEADRFKNLKFTEDVFKIEAEAILGEYNLRVGSDPVMKALELQRDIAYTTHTYKHSAIGFLDDIKDMPNQYEYSKIFFERYYRPENTMILIAGDLDVNETSALVEKHWGDWERGEKYIQDIPEEPAGTGPIYRHLEWESTTLPFVAVAFHGPAFSDIKNDMATMDSMIYYAFSSSSEIYDKLVTTEKKAATIGQHIPDKHDPYLITVYALVFSAEDVAYVQSEIMKTFASLRAEKVSPQKLADTSSYLRYSSANGMDSSVAVSTSLVHYMGLTRDPESWNRVYELYGQITPDDVMEKANEYFRDDRLVVVSLAGAGDPSPENDLSLSIDTIVEEMSQDPPDINSVLLPSDSPLVDFTFLFNVGAVDDPFGKEGLAQLTADMITEASSATMSYEQIKEALYPMAAGLSNGVDKEMTAMKGRVHIANLKKYWDIISTQLLHPAFNENDFERIKKEKIVMIERLIRDNPQMLGVSLLSDVVYGEKHPYGHLSAGYVSSIKNLTVADVRQFYKEKFTRASLVLGMAGGFTDEFVGAVKADLGSLPGGIATVVPRPFESSEMILTPKQGLFNKATIVKRDIGKTSINFGFSTQVTRSHPDYAAISLARAYLGSGMISRLFTSVREIRGLSYGAAAYHEAGGANRGRQEQIWGVYISEVDTLERAHFATRTAFYEFEKMITEGISDEDFNRTRQSLVNSVNLKTATQSSELGYAMDNLYYGMEEEFTSYMKAALDDLTADKVNLAIKIHLGVEAISFVFVTSEADALRDRLANEVTSTITYPSEQNAEVLEEDAIIQDYVLGIKSDNIDILPVETVFEGASSASVGPDAEVDLAPTDPTDAPDDVFTPTETDEDHDSVLFEGGDSSSARSAVGFSKLLGATTCLVVLIVSSS